MSSVNRVKFGSRFGVVAAAAGSAVGLGNIWKFPYELGQNGGSAFLLLYIAFIVLLGMPLMLSELIIGRKAQANPAGAFHKISGDSRWRFAGLLNILLGVSILSFYFVVAGWCLEYVYQAVSNAFVGKGAEELSAVFTDFSTLSFRPLLWLGVFIVLSGAVLLAGVQKGIERCSKLLMPFLVLLLIVLALHSVMMPNGLQGLRFLFYPDFSKLSSQVVIGALGQAFFSLSLGMGTLITYGSYISKKTNLLHTVFQVSIIDTIIAVLAAITIFPVVFSLGVNPAQGAELVFVSLPSIFTHIPGGYWLAILFFLLLVIAALTSTISIQEVLIAYVCEAWKLSRIKAVVITSLLLLLGSTLCSMSLNPESGISILGMSLFNIFDYSSSKVFMPISGLLISVFLGWFFKADEIRAELSSGAVVSQRFFAVYLFLMRYFVPLAIVLVLFHQIGIL
ncbi:MAG: sodium-dependent transporter [Bacteroidales bacterium]